MGFTSRRKRPLDRTITHLRDTSLVVIATEGAKTEKQYFESDLFRNSRVQVKVIETLDNRSAPNHVFSRMKDFAKETQLENDDQLWLVVDKDRWTEHSLREICSKSLNRKIQIQVAVSNPCFELWLYLHHAKWVDGRVSSDRMKDALRKLLGGYNSSKLDVSQYNESNLKMAIEHSKILNTDGRWPENPGTKVYEVVESIHQLCL